MTSNRPKSGKTSATNGLKKPNTEQNFQEGFLWDSEYIFSVTNLDDDRLRERCAVFFQLLRDCKYWREYFSKDSTEKRILGLFEQKKFNNLYHILDEVLGLAMSPAAIKDRGDTAVSKESLPKNTYFIALKKHINEAFAGLFDRCVDTALENDSATEKLTLVRSVERYLYDPAFGNANRSLALDWIQKHMPTSIVSTAQDEVYVDLTLEQDKRIRELRQYLDSLKASANTDA